MNKLYWLIILMLPGRIGHAQGFVPNGDFEQYSGCPTGYSQIDSALSWTVPTSFNSTDYYHQCATNSSVSVPSNGAGFQEAHTGEAYSGIYLLYSLGLNVREYLETPLTSPLIAGTCYHFEMYASLSDISMYTTDAIAVYFSDTLVTAIPYATNIPFPAQINNGTGNMIDATNWTLISGDYTAQGGESYLIIGNFKDDANSAISVVSATGGDNAYAYIEDVSLSVCTSINGPNENTELHIYPNPVKDKIIININNNLFSEITLYDTYSRKILQQNFTGSITIKAAHLPNGIYFYEVRNNDGVIEKGKVVKQ